MNEKDLEQLKHSLRIREIILDKLVLALIVVIAGIYGNFRLKQYETALSRELEGLKAVYNLQRILAEKEIGAHEAAWRSVTEFRKSVDSHIGENLSAETSDQLESAARTLASDLELQRLYLTDRSRAAVEKFFNADVPALIERWGGPDGNGVLTRDVAITFGEATDRVRTVLVSEIQARREPK